MRRRLLAAWLALTVVLLVALEIPLALTYERREREHLEAALQRDAFVLASYVEDALERGDPIDLAAVAAGYANQTGARVVIVDDQGILRADSEPGAELGRSFLSRPEIADALGQQVAVGSRGSETLGTDLLFVAVPVASGGTVHGAVRLTFSTQQLEDRVHRYWAMLGGIAVVSLAAAAGAGYILARWVVRPLAELGAASDAFGSGDLAARAPASDGPPEVRELAHDFNRMADRIEQLVDAQEQFVADASHQLRTPLTALRLRLEVLEGSLPSDAGEETAADLEAAQAEVARLARLVDGLLALARAERADGSATAEVLAIDDVFAERSTVWEPVAVDHGVAVSVERSGLRIVAAPDRLHQVLDNLLANAIEHSPAGGRITLRAETVADADGQVALHVIDQGPGLDEVDRERAFDRFWRSRPGRATLGGSGLGLPIVRKLVAADGGSAALHEAPGGGLDVQVVLPAPGRP